jgi:hypothetical protein
MKKIRLYYLIAKEWIQEKYYGSVYDRFLVVGIAFILLFLLLLITT